MKRKQRPTEKSIDIYCDGSAVPNPGKAGIGIVFNVNSEKIEFCSPIGFATNNQAELTAIQEALDFITPFKNDAIRIYSDSEYAIGVLTKPWTIRKNRELIMRIRKQLRDFTKLRFIHVRGHNGNVGNERADRLANLVVTEEDIPL